MSGVILSTSKCLFHACLVAPQPSEYSKLKKAVPEQQQNQECEWHSSKTESKWLTRDVYTSHGVISAALLVQIPLENRESTRS